jgi:drug/metabolite transporter (DMT)-like permease
LFHNPNTHIELIHSAFQLLSGIVFSALTIIGTYFLINVDKNYGDPFVNRLLVKVLTTIIAIIIGVYLFEEQFTLSKIVGVGLLLAGFYILQF